jgi:hypothetical protein
VLAALVLQILYFFPGTFAPYFAGVARVNADHIAGQQAFFNGELARRFYSYFVAAYLLKTPIAALLATGAGIVLLWRRTAASILRRAFLAVPPAAFVLAATVGADDIGVRYILPALPFAWVAGGVAFDALVAGSRPWGRPVAAGLAAWLAIAAWGIFPDHLSYFNEAACLAVDPSRIGLDGGSRCGPQWLDDSNVDWGQGVKQLVDWQRAHAPDRTLKLAYFGTFPPEQYGLRYEKLDPATLLARPAPGLYAISAFWVGRVPVTVTSVAAGATSWLRDTAPDAVVGHAYYIYDVK